MEGQQNVKKKKDHMKFAISFIFFGFYFVSLYTWLYVLYTSI